MQQIEKCNSPFYYSVFIPVDKGHMWYAYAHKLFYSLDKAILFAQKHNGLIVKQQTLSNKLIIGEVIKYEEKKN